MCSAYCEILNGRWLTHFVIEEYGNACSGAQPLSRERERYHKTMWQEGRKFGAVIHATSQRPQSISKDAVENAGIIWAGNMGLNAAKRVGGEIGIHQNELRQLNVGEFYHWSVSTEAKKETIFKPKTAQSTKKAPNDNQMITKKGAKGALRAL